MATQTIITAALNIASTKFFVETFRVASTITFAITANENHPPHLSSSLAAASLRGIAWAVVGRLRRS